MQAFRRLALASTIATLLLVTIGGLVRATKSGLGCGTDWPHCSGRLVPALERRAMVLEYSHRLAAAVVVVLLATLAVVAWRRLRDRRLLRASWAAFALVVFQALLGAVVVKLELQAISVVLHLAAAMALLAVLVLIVIDSGPQRARERVDPAGGRRAALAAGAVLVLLMLGSYIGGTPGAALAFGDWPLMGGKLVPDLSVEVNALHFAHRLLALAVGVVVAAVCLRTLRRSTAGSAESRLAHAALGAFSLEILVGAANVWTQLNAVVVTLHLFLGVVVWVCLFAHAIVAHR
jgi:cytochrome c oxidase assembly protein subunit 15